MIDKFKFYFNQNKFACLTVLVAVAINTLFVIYSYFVFDHDNTYEYFSFYDSFTLIMVIVNFLTIFVILSMIVINSINFFAKNRLFNYVFNSDNIILFFINPVLMLISQYLFFISFRFDLYRLFKYYEGTSSELITDYLPVIFWAVLLNVIFFIVYFSTIILYRYFTFYNTKYIDGRRKMMYFGLHIAATLVLAFSLITFYEILENAHFNIFTVSLYDYLSSIEMINLIGISTNDIITTYQQPIFNYSFLSMLMIFFALVSLTIVIVKAVSLKKNKNVLKLCRVLATVLVIIMVSFSSLRAYRIYQTSIDVVEQKFSGELAIGYSILADKNATYDEVNSLVINYSDEIGLLEYEFSIIGYDNYGNYHYGTAYLMDDYMENVFMYSDNEAYSEMYNTWLDSRIAYTDISDADDYKLIMGEDPKSITEVVIPESFAMNFVNSPLFLYEKSEELIGRTILGKTIVGIAEDTNEIFDSRSYGKYMIDQYLTLYLEVAFYTNKSFTEESYNIVTNYEYDSEINVFRNLVDKSVLDEYYEVSVFDFREEPELIRISLQGEVNKYSDDLELDYTIYDYSDECAAEYDVANDGEDLCINTEYIIDPGDKLLKEFRVSLVNIIFIGALLFISMLYLTSDKMTGVGKSV